MLSEYMKQSFCKNVLRWRDTAPMKSFVIAKNENANFQGQSWNWSCTKDFPRRIIDSRMLSIRTSYRFLFYILYHTNVCIYSIFLQNFYVQCKVSPHTILQMRYYISIIYISYFHFAHKVILPHFSGLFNNNKGI